MFSVQYRQVGKFCRLGSRQTTYVKRFVQLTMFKSPGSRAPLGIFTRMSKRPESQSPRPGWSFYKNLLLRICSLLKSPLFHWSAGELLDAWPLQLFFFAEASRGLLPACLSRGLQFLSEQMSSSLQFLTKNLVFWLLMCSRRGGLCADGSRVAFLFLKFWENPGRSIRSGTHPTCTMCLCALNDVYCTLVLDNLTNYIY